MKIAVPYQNGNVYHSIMRTGQFRIYEVIDGAISGESTFITHGQRAGVLAALLAAEGVELILCTKAMKTELFALDTECIEVVEGYEGAAEVAVANYLDVLVV